MFGPVVTIAPFDDDEDAIRSANDTRYGLNAMVFTRDLSRAPGFRRTTGRNGLG
jgi:acyl-CoA reductase-like NAD-dependent aldehyde dehydrogenase